METTATQCADESNWFFKLIQTALIAIIDVYRYLLSPLIGNQCRFYPSCSSYARQAILAHGSLKGCMLAVSRLLRCHPWHNGGIDPVPASCQNLSDTSNKA